ncbi:MAG: hypothetical protein LBJ32_04270 [Oscillospiraceae bacterium]|jgi:hypothetical protein|nr:hypothetical protein [Oscillospiraceae bacterium]
MANNKIFLGSVKSPNFLKLINRAKSILKIQNLFKVKKFFKKALVTSLSTLFVVYSVSFISLNRVGAMESLSKQNQLLRDLFSAMKNYSLRGRYFEFLRNIEDRILGYNQFQVLPGVMEIRRVEDHLYQNLSMAIVIEKFPISDLLLQEMSGAIKDYSIEDCLLRNLSRVMGTEGYFEIERLFQDLMSNMEDRASKDCYFLYMEKIGHFPGRKAKTAQTIKMKLDFLNVKLLKIEILMMDFRNQISAMLNEMERLIAEFRQTINQLYESRIIKRLCCCGDQQVNSWNEDIKILESNHRQKIDEIRKMINLRQNLPLRSVENPEATNDAEASDK